VEFDEARISDITDQLSTLCTSQFEKTSLLLILSSSSTYSWHVLLH